ncbi:unnamed protein product [Vitrella brassicaformis CCMP3155]|uniref:Dolichol-phosphate mannosyltransferase subunit 3 n=2 Tax=Vitrella brassicaformis TaxID=1169539 RepID=A0A0G4GEJ3_VITBC|nr:unnamed protein product [Vitrella brassicaformis CCMP3155]|eukprot:CEM27791.1 unnamed protein product [Vitrella brassicaformis CCMP3155]
MALPRGKVFVALLSVATVVWLCGLFVLPDGHARFLWRVSPLYVVMLFGTYSLACIGWGLLTFSECPEAAKELEQQVKEACDDLAKKGMRLNLAHS